MRIANHPDCFYYQKVSLKKNKDGSPRIGKDGKQELRILYPSTDRLKEIQKRINDRILSSSNYFKLPDYAYGALQGRDNVLNARKHQGKKYNFTTDLKKFFPSINHKAVFSFFRSSGFSPTVSSLLTKLTTYKGQLPQGAPTSPLLANLVFMKTGIELASYCQQAGITFTTFVDDLTFSSSQDFQKHHKPIIDLIKKAGFKISYAKTQYRTKNPVVTGVIVKNNCLDVTSDFKQKLLDAMHGPPARLTGLLQYRKKVITT